MFIVVYEDGKVAVQGRDLSGWDDVITNKSIASVILTDGYNIQESLTGYDYYLCVYWDKAVIHSSASGSSSVMNNKKSKTTDQSLYGIRDNKKLIHSIDTAYSVAIGKIKGFYNTNFVGKENLLKKARNQITKEVNDKRDKLKELAKSVEVTEVKLSVTKSNYPREDLKQSLQSFKVGTGGDQPISDKYIGEQFRIR